MIGDILVFSDESCSAVIYHTHDNKLMGSLVRVFCCGNSDADPADIVNESIPIITCFFPVKAALRGKLLKRIAICAPKGDLALFPIFKCEGIDMNASGRASFWLWDGLREWIYDGKHSDLIDYPTREIINDTLMIHRVKSLCIHHDP